MMVTDSSLAKDKAYSILNTKDYQQKELPAATERVVDINLSKEHLNDKLNNILRERNIESAKEGLEELRMLLKNLNNLIVALSLILDIYERNPLIINKCMIAKEAELSRLIFLLTNVEQIEMMKIEPEIKFCGASD